MRIAIYYSDEGTLGHSVRVGRIAAFLERQGHELLVLGGGAPAPVAGRAGSVRVPFPFHSRRTFFSGDYRPGRDEIRKRLRFMDERLSDFAPDAFITEYFPLGRLEERLELVPLARRLRKRPGGARIFCSMGYPFMDLGRADEILELSGLYDGIFIHSPAMEEESMKRLLDGRDRETYSRVREGIGEKMSFTGYVLGRGAGGKVPGLVDELPLDGRKLVLVSRGGGIMYPRIVTDSIKAAAGLRDECFFLVACGPASTPREAALFGRAAAAADNVRLVPYLDGFPGCLERADVSVSMSGYNTSVETLHSGRRSVLVPSGRDLEQVCRAGILRRLIGSSVLDYGTLSPERLAGEISRQLARERERVPVDEGLFDGLENLHRSITGG
jgi:predicted glycosyltransferase